MDNCDLIKKWLDAFGKDVDADIMEKWVTAEYNYLWHIFTWGNALCLEGDEARQAFDELCYDEAIKFYDGYSNKISDISIVNKISAKSLDEEKGWDVFIVAKDFSWTYVRTHERDMCGPYFAGKTSRFESE